MVGKGIVLLLVTGVAALGWTKHEDRIREQKQLSVVASTLVGHKVGVHCPNFLKGLVYTSAEAGTVKFDENGQPADYTDLAPDTCRALRRIGKVDLTCLDSATCGDKQWQLGWALHTLAHESYHLRGIGQESVAECYAMQTTARVAVSLGIPRRRAGQLQHWVWTRGYADEPDEYQTVDCHDGGRLDLHHAYAVWP
jgi:hypothetical protein